MLGHSRMRKTEKIKWIAELMADNPRMDYTIAETLWWYNQTPERKAKLQNICEQHQAGTLTHQLNDGCTDWTKFKNNEIMGAVTYPDKNVD